jgi:hypothetical protein
MTLDQIKDLSDKALLNLYEQFVCMHHYCPMATPDYAVELYRNKISPDDIKEVILDRLNPQPHWWGSRDE